MMIKAIKMYDKNYLEGKANRNRVNKKLLERKFEN